MARRETPSIVRQYNRASLRSRRRAEGRLKRSLAVQRLGTSGVYPEDLRRRVENLDNAWARRENAIEAQIRRTGDKELIDWYPHVRKSPGIQTEAELRRLVGEVRRIKEADTPADRFIKKTFIAPAGKALEQTTRPIHAVTGGVIAAKRRENVLRGFGRGAALKDKYWGSDVLKEFGVKGVPAAVGGFVFDVLADPITHGRGGLVSPAQKQAAKVAQKAQKAARAAGKTDRQIRRAGQRAFRKTLAKTDPTRGIGLQVFGKTTSGRTTAAIGRGVRRAGAKVPGAPKVAENVRGALSEINPYIRPKGIGREQWVEIRGAQREARAAVSRGRYKAIQQGLAIQRQLGRENFGKVINAIERGTYYDLPYELRRPAERMVSAFRQARRAELRAGIPTAYRRGYFPHISEDLLLPGARNRGSGLRVIRPGYAKGRRHQGTVQDIAQREGKQFTENAPLAVARRLTESARDVGHARFNKALAKVGRPLEAGVRQKVTLDRGEAIYRQRGADIHKLSETERRLFESGKHEPGSRYVVLPQRLADTAIQRVTPELARSTFGMGFDRATGAFKLAATQFSGPAYHLRNLMGDIQQAYLTESVPRLGRNLRHSRRAIRVLGEQERALGGQALPKQWQLRRQGVRKLAQKQITVKDHLGNKRKLTYAQLVNEAERHGAIRQGFLAGELSELARGGVVRLRGRNRVVAGTSRALQNREDLARLATYLGGRQRGLTPRQAAERSSRQHFDYRDLTPLERTFLRRVMPFYTWSARDIPLQARSLIAAPGKFANIEKLRQETAIAFGFPSDWEQQVKEYQARAVGVPIKWKGKPLLIQPGLPVQDLNSLTLSPAEHAKKVGGLLNPGIRSPIELYTNYNLFFRDPIERDTSPLVAAPGYVAAFPKETRDALGIVEDYVDPRTGKKTWGWPGKMDYVSHLVPGVPNFVQGLATSGSGRRGQDREMRIWSWATGLRADPYLPAEAKLTRAYDIKTNLEKERAKLRQRGLKGGPEWRRLGFQIKLLDTQIEAFRRTRQEGRLQGAGRRILSTGGAAGGGGRRIATIGGGISEGRRIAP